MRSLQLGILALALSFAVQRLTAVPLLYDDFAGTAVDSSKWTFSAPFPSSSVTVADGNAEFRNRGRLLSVDTFSGALDITGRFQVAGNQFEQFSIATRTTGVSTNPSGDWNTGVRFEVVPVYFGGSTANNIKIAPVENWAGIPAAFATYTINVGEWYDFRIVDTGTLTSFYIGDLTTPLLSLNVNFVGGNHIGLLNIEGPDGGSFFTAGNLTKLDYIRVEGVPDMLGTGAALFASLGLLGIIRGLPAQECDDLLRRVSLSLALSGFQVDRLDSQSQRRVFPS